MCRSERRRDDTAKRDRGCSLHSDYQVVLGFLLSQSCIKTLRSILQFIHSSYADFQLSDMPGVEAAPAYHLQCVATKTFLTMSGADGKCTTNTKGDGDDRKVLSLPFS